MLASAKVFCRLALPWSGFVRGWVIIVALVAGFLAGCPDSEFRCSNTEECLSGGADGFCEPNGFCSFEDLDCESGRRYGELAGDLAFQCVEVSAAGSGSGDDGETGSPPTGGDVDSGQPVDGSSDGLDSATTLPADEGPVATTSTSGDTDTTAAPSDTTAASEETGFDVQSASFGERPDADYQGVTTDSFLSFFELGNNYGEHPDLHIHGDGSAWQVSLLRFDLSALGGVTVVSADLLLHNESKFSSGTVQAHALLEPWLEGDVDNELGTCNWLERELGVSWTDGGAQGASRADDVVATVSLDEPFTEYAVSVAPAVLQLWVDAPDQNHGLVLESHDVPDALYFSSSEAFDGSWRPLLVVRYVQ